MLRRKPTRIPISQSDVAELNAEIERRKQQKQMNRNQYDESKQNNQNNNQMVLNLVAFCFFWDSLLGIK